MPHQYSVDDGNTWIEAPEGLRLRYRDVPAKDGETLFALIHVKPAGFHVELVDQDTGEASGAEITLSAIVSTIMNTGLAD